MIILLLAGIVIYNMTRSNSLVSIDAGELATVQLLPGIAHPTGYPLFTMLGYLWSQIPWGIAPIAQLNILAALYCALALPIVYQAASNLLGNTERHESAPSALLAIGILMFSSTFWSTSTGTEVYSLHILLMALVLWGVSKVILEQGTRQRTWLVLAMLLGISFANHLTTIVFIPGIAFLFVRYRPQNPFMVLGQGTLIFAVVTGSLYSYLYFMANSDPLMNWGDPGTFDRLWSHVSGQQYRVYTFNSIDVAYNNLGYLIRTLPNEITWAGSALALLGMVQSWRYNRSTCMFLGVSILTCTVLAINYSIPDLGPYFLPVYFCFAGFIAFGVKKLTNQWRNRLPGPLNTGLVFLIPLYLLIFNFQQVDQSKNYVLEDYSVHALTTLDSNAILMSNEFETDISSAYYTQHILETRPDVDVVDFLSFIEQDWYLDYMNREMPTLFANVQQELDEHMKATKSVAPPEATLRAERQRTFRLLLHSLVKENLKSRPIYIAHGVYRDYLQPSGYIPLPFDHWIVPQPFYYRVRTDDEYQPLEAEYAFDLRYPQFNDDYTTQTQQYGKPKEAIYRDPKYHIGEIRYARALMMDHRVQYEIRHHRWEEASLIVDLIVEHYPNYILDSRILRAIEDRQSIR